MWLIKIFSQPDTFFQKLARYKLKAKSNAPFGNHFLKIYGANNMKNLSRVFYFASLLITLAFTSTTFADVKIKSRQTMSGQTFENTTYIKGKRQRTEQNMGAMQMINLTQCDLKRGVQMNPNAKTYFIDMFNQVVETTNQTTASTTKKDGVVRAGGTVTSTITYKDTGETRKMFGYNAKHIITTMETVSSPDACSPSNTKMQFDGWYIDAAFALDCETEKYRGGYNSYQKGGCQDKYQMKTIGNSKRGYPVYEKMTMFDESGKEMMSTVNEVIELSQATLDQSLFEIPEDYREVKDASQIYSASSMTMNSNSNSTISMSSNSSTMNSGMTNSGTISAIKNQIAVQILQPKSARNNRALSASVWQASKSARSATALLRLSWRRRFRIL